VIHKTTSTTTTSLAALERLKVADKSFTNSLRFVFPKKHLQTSRRRMMMKFMFSQDD